MKITDTRIGKDALRIGESIAKNVEAAEKANAPAPAQGAPKAHDAFDPAANKAAIASETEQLRKLMDQANQLLGPEAVRELRNALPKAAVDALETAAPALPLLPGKGVYATYRAKMEQLLQLEGVARDVGNVAFNVVNTSVYSSRYSSSQYPQREMKAAMVQLRSGRALSEVRVEDQHERGCGRPNVPLSESDLKRYINDIHHINDTIKGAWPFETPIPNNFLLQDEMGRGPGTGTLDQLGYGSHMPGLKEIRTAIPGYTQLLKEVVQLRAHLKEAALPSEGEIKEAKAQLMNKELTIGEMHQEVATLLQEVQGMANTSQIKRETLKGTHKSTTASQGESFSRDPAFGIKLDGRESNSVSQTSGSSTSQQLNLEARAFEFVVVPNLEGASLSQVDKTNYISLVESSIVIEKLLRAERVYEAMVALEPSAPETQGLKMFMDESTFKFGTINDDYSTKDVGKGELKMVTLRADLLKVKDAQLYPADRYDIVKQEIQEGPPRPPSKLKGGRSLADL